MFVVNVDLRASRFLLRGELPAVALTSGDELDSGIGDFKFRAKMNLVARPGWDIQAIGSLRTGSGKNTLFPYATGSVDFELGLAAVDTISTITAWVTGSGTYATRVNDRLETPDLHGNFITLAGGVVYALAERAAIELGGQAYTFRGSGGERWLVFTDVDIRYRPNVSLYVTGQGEVGDEAYRAIDWCVGAGAEIRF